MTRTFVLTFLVALTGVMLFASNANATTMTFSSLSGSPYSYTEGGFRVYSNYSGSGDHLHDGNGTGGSNTGISNHTSCCSSPYVFHKSNNTTWTLSSIRNISGSGTFTSNKGGSQSISGNQTITFSGSQWTDVTTVTWSGSGHLDNVVWTDCSSTTAQAGGPYSVAEGSSVTLSGSGTGAANYTWDFDSGSGVGPYNDATGSSPTYNASGINGTSAVTIGMQNSCGGGGGTSSDTATVNVANVAPSLTATIPSTGIEGASVSFSVSATDPGPDTLTYAWAFGDGTPNGTSASTSHTYTENGVYTVTISVNDGEATTISTSTITITNANPVAAIGGDSTGVEGTALNFTGSATDAGSLDTFTYAWTFGDGSTSTAQNPSHAYVDEGTGIFTVSLTVTDDDGGTNTVTTSVTITNVAPVVTSATATTEAEGTPVAFTASSTDVGTADTVTYSWTFGDGSTGSGAAPNHAYADDGTYTASVIATDNDGGISAPMTVTVTVSNVAPSVATLSGPTTGDEGSALTFGAVGSDPGSVDAANLTWSWDWGDATAVGTGNGPSHAWADDTPGPYTITVTVTDPQSATGTDTYVVTINNVAPTINTLPSLFADEGVQWTYQAGSFDPGADPANWTLSPSSPANASVDASGLVTWTPDFTQVGAITFTITVDDGDGGTDVQSWTVQVGFTDADGDGMADTWETDNGLDPTIDDSGLDPDGDGLTNLDEFLNGQDPNVSGLPAPPVLTDPIAGVQVSDPRPFLTWDPAVDPNGDALVYDVEIYEDLAMSLLVTTMADVDALTWQTDTQLSNENADYYWRVRAYDGWGWSIWSNLEDFFLNEFNEPPGPPTAIYPVDREQIGTLTPAAEMDEGVDPDRDAVGHRVRVWNADHTELLTEGWMPPGARTVNWQVDMTLEEDTWYAWDAQAEDEHGLTSDWIEPEEFFATSENAPPLDVRWTDPVDGSSVESVSPTMTYTLSSDPEGRDVDYEIDLDTDSGFGSGAQVSFLQELGDNGTLDLAVEGTELDENTWWNARVRAIDQDGGTSVYDVIEFFVRGDNDPPPTPVLISPADGSVLESPVPVLAVAHVEDPEGDLVIYEIVVSRDAEGTDVVASGNGLLAGAGPEGTADQTSWRTDVNIEGEVYWTARAVDERGAASDYADPWILTLDSGEPDGPTVDDILTGGCVACTGEASVVSADNPVGFLAMGMLLLIPVVRRRR